MALDHSIVTVHIISSTEHGQRDEHGVRAVNLGTRELYSKRTEGMPA